MKASEIGETYTLLGFKPTINKAYRKKLLAFGFTPKTEFTIIRVAPLGDPIEVKLRGFSVTLRKDELDGLIAIVKSASCESNNCQTCH